MQWHCRHGAAVPGDVPGVKVGLHLGVHHDHPLRRDSLACLSAPHTVAVSPASTAESVTDVRHHTNTGLAQQTVPHDAQQQSNIINSPVQQRPPQLGDPNVPSAAHTAAQSDTCTNRW
jgi:hypothetical protein